MKHVLLLLTGLLAFVVPAHAGSIETPLEEEVAEVERAFARTMETRDFEAFKSFLDDNAVFVSGPQVLRGREAVAAAWKPLFEGEAAPFSWKPETVIALPSGTLAHSSGPVMGPDGTVGVYYQSTWRKGADGAWKIIFDKGQELCPKEPAG